MEAGISIGSNLGDRLANLRASREGIASIPAVQVVASSPVYETEPVGVKPEYRDLKFLNTVLIVETTLSADELQEALAAVEEKLGRLRGDDRFAPRIIDIDILYAGPLVTETERLTLPHPRWARRRFVVQPLADVRASLILPGVSQTVQDILDALPPGEDVALFAREW